MALPHTEDGYSPQRHKYWTEHKRMIEKNAHAVGAGQFWPGMHIVTQQVAFKESN